MLLVVQFVLPTHFEAQYALGAALLTGSNGEQEPGQT